MTDAQTLDVLGRAKYVRLTTFKKDGTAVPTPVWLVRDADHLLVITALGTGKAKRLGHTSRVLLAPCDGRGRVKPGVTDVEATAELLTDLADVERTAQLVKARYGFMYTVAMWAQRRRGTDVSQGAAIRITV
ncbi:MAG: PPOX class F420-dependent oxidoreductase [Actinobacteria bacterium]|nr:PPOX class F420-dependent oxidoreductase [Actinomycetota bacterium]